MRKTLCPYCKHDEAKTTKVPNMECLKCGKVAPYITRIRVRPAKSLLMIAILSLFGCGFNGNQKLETNDSKQQIEQTGTSYTYIVVRLEFIEQIRLLCLDANPIEDFTTESQRNKAVAQCTIDNMAILNINLEQVDDFTGQYCEDDADLSQYTPEQISDILAACAALGGTNAPTP